MRVFYVDVRKGTIEKEKLDFMMDKFTPESRKSLATILRGRGFFPKGIGVHAIEGEGSSLFSTDKILEQFLRGIGDISLRVGRIEETYGDRLTAPNSTVKIETYNPSLNCSMINIHDISDGRLYEEDGKTLRKGPLVYLNSDNVVAGEVLLLDVLKAYPAELDIFNFGSSNRAVPKTRDYINSLLERIQMISLVRPVM